MKAIPYLVLVTLFPILTANAGDDARAKEQQEWMKQAITKERERAQENVKLFGNTARLEEKFGWAKEKQPEFFNALMGANKKAADSWSAVLQKAESATNPDVLAESKQAANEATANAYLAEMTLKYAASAAERKGMAEKSRDRDVASLISKLDANEKSILIANRTKNEAQATAEKLQIENRMLNNALREAYEKAKAKDQEKDKDKDRDKDHEKQKHEEERPKNPTGGGGVLGS
jgi:hypothetical protein